MNPKIACIGAGIIGAGLAVNALLSGYNTYIQDICSTNIVEDRIKSILDSLVRNSVCSEEEASKAYGNVVFTNSVEEAVSGAQFIQEACPDNIMIKQSTYEAIEDCCPHDAIISSTSTTLMPSELQSKMKHPDRFLVGHPFHPSYLIPLVEICPGEKTSKITIERANNFYKSIGKYPVVCRKEVKGAIVNRLCWAINNEAKNAVSDGICTAEELDRAFMYGPGLRMCATGLLLTMDLGVAGGIRCMAEKYGGTSTPEDIRLANMIDEELLHRSVQEGNTRDEVAEYRDKMIISILRTQNML